MLKIHIQFKDNTRITELMRVLSNIQITWDYLYIDSWAENVDSYGFDFFKLSDIDNFKIEGAQLSDGEPWPNPLSLSQRYKDTRGGRIPYRCCFEYCENKAAGTISILNPHRYSARARISSITIPADSVYIDKNHIEWDTTIKAYKNVGTRVVDISDKYIMKVPAGWWNALG